jgi:biotin carboxyl carrier protein
LEPAEAVAPSPARVIVELDRRRIPVRVWGDDVPSAPTPPRAVARSAHAHAADTITAPMQGTILQMVEEGQEIEGGQVVCILEAMKMENHIAATHDGKVASVAVKAGDVLDTGQVLVGLE